MKRCQARKRERSRAEEDEQKVGSRRERRRDDATLNERVRINLNSRRTMDQVLQLCVHGIAISARRSAETRVVGLWKRGQRRRQGGDCIFSISPLFLVRLQRISPQLRQIDSYYSQQLIQPARATTWPPLAPRQLPRPNSIRLSTARASCWRGRSEINPFSSSEEAPSLQVSPFHPISVKAAF